MKKKTGMTLVMLVIYIVVALILTSAISISFFRSTQIGNTNEKAFKSKIKDYMDEFNINKNYYIINNVDITTLTIDDLIPSITINDKKFLKISEDGNLIYYDIPEGDKRIGYLQDLGISNNESNIRGNEGEEPAQDIVLDLAISLNDSASLYGVTVSTDSIGNITVSGTYTKNTGIFIRLSDNLVASANVGELTNENIIIANAGDDLRYETEHISGSITIDDDQAINEFNAALRGYTSENIGAAEYKIMMLENETKNPSNGEFGKTPLTIDYAYIYIKGKMTFNDYKFKVNLLKQPDNVHIDPVIDEPIDDDSDENITNPLLLYPGVVNNTGNLSIEVLSDYTIKINGTANLAKMYVIFLRDGNTCILGSHNGIGTMIKDYSSIATVDQNIAFGIEHISGTITIPDGIDNKCNVVLRSVNSATSPTTIKTGGAEFNCVLKDDITSVTGVVSTRDAKILGIYINGAVAFDNYTIRPTLTIN